MARLTHELMDTFMMSGVREDLADFISNISPIDLGRM